MAVRHLFKNLSPLIFSDFYRYYTLAFFGLAIVGLFIDNNAGRDFPSDGNIAILLAYPLAIIYFFGLAIDTLLWIIRKPNEFLEIAKRKSRRSKGGFLSQHPSKIWSYYLFCAFILLVGTLLLIGTTNMFMR